MGYVSFREGIHPYIYIHQAGWNLVPWGERDGWPKPSIKESKIEVQRHLLWEIWMPGKWLGEVLGASWAVNKLLGDKK